MDSSTRKEALSSLRIDRSEPAKYSGGARSRFSWVLWITVLLLLSLAGLYFAKQQGWTDNWQIVPDAIKKRPEVRIVRLTTQRGRAAEALVVASGYLESRRQAKIGAKAVGRVQSVFVEEGTKVTKDQVLAILEHSDLEASLAATLASLARSKTAIEEQSVLIQQNKRELERARNLLASRSISNTEHDKAKFDYDSAVVRLKSMQVEVKLAEARLREAQQLKENMFIRAPFDGTVISKDAEVGESIMPGGMGEASGRGSAVTIADLDNLEVDCDVKEDYISRVSAGQLTEVAVDAVPNRRYHGVVRKIIPMGDRARATIKVKVSITDVDERLFPNMSSTVYFLPEGGRDEAQDQRLRTFCPSECIVQGENGSSLWIVDANDHAQQLIVQVGTARDGKMEILSSVEGNPKIIANPPVDLQIGQPLKIIN
jgi:RND family efflux transporter MFP subunit